MLHDLGSDPDWRRGRLARQHEVGGPRGAPHRRRAAIRGAGRAAGYRERIWHLPRGCRWRWHDREWLALGGAVSLDLARRTPGQDWWPEEEITWRQAGAVISAGPADVMVTHECPAGVEHTFPPPPSWWAAADLRRSDAHRALVREVVLAVRPHWLMHGHLHIGYQRRVDFGSGPVEVTGLDCDGAEHSNWAILDVASMRWISFQGKPLSNAVRSLTSR
jgi:hypothetical protein